MSADLMSYEIVSMPLDDFITDCNNSLLELNCRNLLKNLSRFAEGVQPDDPRLSLDLENGIYIDYFKFENLIVRINLKIKAVSTESEKNQLKALRGKVQRASDEAMRKEKELFQSLTGCRFPFYVI